MINKWLFLLFMFTQSLMSFSQTSFSIGTGQNIIDLKVNKFLSNKSQLGIHYAPRIIEEVSSYIGPIMSYQIIPYGDGNYDEAKWHPYFCASVGAIRRKLESIEIGGYLSCGVAYGAKNFSIFGEVGIGKMPNSLFYSYGLNVDYTTKLPFTVGASFSIPKKNKNMYIK